MLNNLPVDERIKKYLSSRNCSFINPIWNDMHRKKIVGYQYTAPSLLRLDNIIEGLEGKIQELNLDYSITISEFTKSFSVYLNN